jgi:DNA invertase Pin-like site-specific DNA recombinase
MIVWTTSPARAWVGMTELLAHARPRDRIVVHTLDRLSRNLPEVLNLVRALRERGIGVKSLTGPVPIDTNDEGMGRVAVLLLALLVEMECTFATERAAHARAVAEAAGHRGGWPAADADADADAKIEYARSLRREGRSRSQVTKKTGITNSSLHCCLGLMSRVGEDRDPW